MRNTTTSLSGFLIGIAFVLSCAVSADENLSTHIERFFSPPAFEHPQLSPDGKYLAAISSNVSSSRSRNLILIDLDNDQAIALTDNEHLDVFYFVWVGSERILYSVSYYNSDTNNFELPSGSYILDLKTKVATPANAFINPVLEFPEYHVTRDGVSIVNDRFVRSLHINSQPPQFRQGGTNRALPSSPPFVSNYDASIYQIDTMSGEIGVFQKNNIDAQYWVSDSRGDYRAALATTDSYSDSRNSLMVLESDGEWSEAARFDAGDMIPLRFDSSGRYLFVAARNHSDKLELFRFDLETKSLGAPLVSDLDYDVYDRNTGMRHLVVDNSGRPIFYEYMAGKPVVQYFDPRWQAWQSLIDEKIPNRVNRLIGWDNAYRRILVQSESDRSDPQYYVLNAFDGVLETSLEAQERGDISAFPSMEVAWLPLPTGLKLHAYLLSSEERPVAARPTVIVLNDFAFDDRFVWGFSPTAQAIAAEGYNVMLLDRRGSSGYGKEMRKSGWGELGQGMQDDIATAIRWAVESDIAPSGEICLMGRYFGAYATIKALAGMPQLVRCGIAIQSIVRLQHWPRLAMVPSPHYNWELSIAESQARIGGYKLPKKVRAPHHYLDDTQGSLLVIYRDFPVEFRPAMLGDQDESHWLLKQLKKKNLPHEIFVVDDSEDPDPQFVRDKNSTARAIQFLRQNLPIESPTADID